MRKSVSRYMMLWFVMLVGCLGLATTAAAQSHDVQRQSSKVLRQYDDVNDALNNLIQNIRTLGEDLNNEVSAIEEDFDSMEACQNRGWTYTGDKCYEVPRVDDTKLKFNCAKKYTYPSCPSGYKRVWEGRTTDAKPIYACDTYCEVKVGYICIWWGYKYHHYSHCEKYAGDKYHNIPAY